MKTSNPLSSPFIKRGKCFTSLLQREVGRDFVKVFWIKPSWICLLASIFFPDKRFLSPLFLDGVGSLLLPLSL
jgi:hypothetical protein